MFQTETDTRKRKIQPQDIEALQKRAAEIGQMGHPDSEERVRQQARATYALALDFYRLGVLGQDFPRWMSVHSGMSHSTCYRRQDQGREMAHREAAGQKVNRNGSGLLAEYRERKLTPRPELEAWDDDED
ncbi:hypothetical protein [Deinococcus sp. Marseille-Q6407]|uniref:hypothetical protein n=1 Tax=Deinococcus sp. Marseille-Q6407 TaxID=2969223 RepID=UPI0021C03EA0|nr:hypothetical protein [Deinococcus sp. Marseille-Q6407]